jgi:hypothetical protein
MNKIKISIKDFSTSGGSFPVKAKVIAGSLMSIYERKNELTAESVVNEARNKNNPLHACFEWNNTKAAHEYRLSRARVLISCVVMKKEINGEQRKIRAFVNIKRDEKGNLSTNPYAKGESNYIFVNSAMDNDVTTKYTIDRALIDLQNLMDKYNNLVELSALFGMIKKKIKSIKKK